MSNNRNAGIRISPESSAGRTSFGVPLEKLSQGDSKVRHNGSTSFTLLDKMELIAVIDHARLNSVGGLDTYL